MYAAERIFKKALIFSIILHGILLVFLEGKLSPLPPASLESYAALNISVALNPPSEPEKRPETKEVPLERPAAEEQAVVKELPPVEETAPVKEAAVLIDAPESVEVPEAVIAPEKVAMNSRESQIPASAGSEFAENPVSLSREPSYSGESLDSLSFDNARMPVPVYPSRAKKMEWEGDVTVSFVINKKGKVDSLVIEESSGYELLDKSVADTLKKGWRFPRREDSLRVWKTFSFRLI